MQVSGEADWMFWVGAAIFLVGVGNGIFLSNRRLERRIYWLCWVAGGLVMVLATRAQNPERTLSIVGFSVAMATMMAFFRPVRTCCRPRSGVHSAVLHAAAALSAVL